MKNLLNHTRHNYTLTQVHQQTVTNSSAEHQAPTAQIQWLQYDRIQQET